MTSYRWTTHRVYDAAGNDRSGPAAISMWWLARAAAEETLQGSPLAAAWLKLFRTQLSEADPYWLRWCGDLAESAELRRAYSGLYGRFTARALLREHLGFSRFLSLQRNGLLVPGAVEVIRTSRGDIPDWLAWDDARASYVLGEAKGSLTARDFLSAAVPKCVRQGKEQFDRVTAVENGRTINPARWVAATRWATDDRKGDPATLLWDPPVDKDPNWKELAPQRRRAMTRAWLASLAPAFGYSGADDLLSDDRGREALIVRASPGERSEDWPTGDEDPRLSGRGEPQETRQPPTAAARVVEALKSDLLQSEIYPDSEILSPKGPEEKGWEGTYVAAVITRFGVRPIRSQGEFESMRREQDRARQLEEPAMLVGIPVGLNADQPRASRPWMDGAGIAQKGDLALFDLGSVEVELADSKALSD